MGCCRSRSKTPQQSKDKNSTETEQYSNHLDASKKSSKSFDNHEKIQNTSLKNLHQNNEKNIIKNPSKEEEINTSKTTEIIVDEKKNDLDIEKLSPNKEKEINTSKTTEIIVDEKKNELDIEKLSPTKEEEINTSKTTEIIVNEKKNELDIQKLSYDAVPEHKNEIISANNNNQKKNINSNFDKEKQNLDTKKNETSIITQSYRCGLSNKGNTCFMNSVLQAIAHFSEFKNLLKDLNTSENKFIISLYKLTQAMISSSNVDMMLDRFINQLKEISSFGNGRQHDSKVFYRFIINQLNLSLEKNNIPKTSLYKYILTRQIITFKDKSRKSIENLLPIIECNGKTLFEIEKSINDCTTPYESDPDIEYFEEYQLSKIIAIGFDQRVDIPNINHKFIIQEKQYIIDFILIRYGQSIYSGHEVALSRESETTFRYYNDSYSSIYAKTNVNDCHLIFLKRQSNE